MDQLLATMAAASAPGSVTSGADASADPPSKPRLPSWVYKMPRNAFDESVCKRRVEWSYTHGERLPCPPACSRLFRPLSSTLTQGWRFVTTSAARDLPARSHEEARLPPSVRQQPEYPVCELSDGAGRRLPPTVQAGARLCWWWFRQLLLLSRSLPAIVPRSPGQLTHPTHGLATDSLVPKPHPRRRRDD